MSKQRDVSDLETRVLAANLTQYSQYLLEKDKNKFIKDIDLFNKGQYDKVVGSQRYRLAVWDTSLLIQSSL